MKLMPFLQVPRTTSLSEDARRTIKLRVSDGFGFGVSA